MRRAAIAISIAAGSLTMLVAACGSDQSKASAEPTTTTRVDVASTQGVAGHVRDADGRALADVVVAPRSLDDPAPAVPEIAQRTNADGAYQWTLPVGRWELRASLDGYTPSVRTVDVARASTATVDFTLVSSN